MAAIFSLLCPVLHILFCKDTPTPTMGLGQTVDIVCPAIVVKVGLIRNQGWYYDLPCRLLALFLMWSHRFHVARSKKLESVVACHVSNAPIGINTKVDIHMPTGATASSRTDFSLIIPIT